MWQVVAATVTGPSHAATGNEDAVEFEPASGVGKRVRVAIADGHGGSAYTRSSVGAHLAVAAALAELGSGEPSDEEAVLDATRRIVGRWNRLVDADLARQPLRTGRTAYGTTLVALAAGDGRVACSQIGDGRILVVDGDGAVSSPMPDDPRLVGNVTTSLAGAEPVADARIAVLPAAGIRLVLACSDGYENSFADQASFFQAASDLLGIADEHGLGLIRRELSGWLQETTSAGSGDDTSVALIMPSGDSHG